jgi:hypothetical protein
VRSLLRVLGENRTSHLMALRGNGERQRRSESRAEQIKRIVKRTGLNMAQISAATSASCGRNTPFFVPPTFLYKQKEGVTPHVCQIIALSWVTGYRFTDWMRICGFDLELIFALQIELHVERTVSVTPDQVTAERRPSPPSWNRAWRDSRRRYLFAKIGRSDAVVHPRILPGSIVRADCTYSPEVSRNGSDTDALWLVEYPGGLTCCQIERVDQTHIVLLPHRAPLPSWPLRLTKEARVLGLLDMELRPRDVPEQTAYHPSRFEHRPVLPRRDGAMKLSTLVRVSRSRAGLTLREAHDMTMAVARLLGNQAYGIALGQLSDYEATVKLPRHVAKMMSLCIIYGIHAWDLMAAAGIRVDDSGKAPLDLDESGPELLTSSYLGDRHWEERDVGVEDGAATGGRVRRARVVA